ncbi:MAG: hypothetical protein KAQ85_06720 [Thermodesulfovibrionia bacterium]|nr:hypothetical protein [Thermodesulfovibrionia bacterium]
MRFLNWQTVLGLTLFVLSALVYFIHFLIFRDPYHIFIYMIGDIAFVFIEVLMVTLIIHRLLSVREKRSMLEKLNMIIGAFFSEVGTGLLTYLSDFDTELNNIKKELVVNTSWSGKEFSKVRKNLKNFSYEVEIRNINLEYLRNFLIEKRVFLVRLLENPNLLEHESFTDLLWAVFHLTEELSVRKDIKHLPDTDYKHLVIDIKRAYTLLVREWIDYMEHLKNNYPYLFSLAMRTNPFDEKASPIVQ